MSLTFRDRSEAGRQLAAALIDHDSGSTVVLAVPRGGVPVAYEVAAALGLRLDLVMVRKLGVPFHRELALGAIGSSGVRVLNEEVIRLAGLDEETLASIERNARREMAEHERRLRAECRPILLFGLDAVVIDDGIATGATARAACETARRRGARHVTLAAPVAAASVISKLSDDADEVVVLQAPPRLAAVGECYVDFSQTPDLTVTSLLRRARMLESSSARVRRQESKGGSPVG